MTDEIPGHISAWCEENDYTEPHFEAGHWRAFPEGAVMSVPAPRSMGSTAFNLSIDSSAYQSEYQSAVRSLGSWAISSSSRHQQSATAVHVRGDTVTVTFSEPIQTALDRLPNLSKFFVDLASARVFEILTEDITDWEHDPLDLMQFFPAKDLSAINIRRHIAYQVYRFSDWLDDVSTWIEPD